MRKLSVICLIAITILSLASPGYCGSPARKLGRGIANMLTCPLEIPNRLLGKHSREGVNETLYGIAEGISMTAIRLTVGAIEVVTFPFPVPSPGYEPMLKDPEFLISEAK